jgi:hypothetical protein
MPTFAQVSVGQARSSTAQVRQEHQLMGGPVGVAGHKLLQQGAVRLRHDRMQQGGRGDHQHIGRLGVVGRVEAQAEGAIRHPAGLQDLPVGIGAKLRRAPPPGRWADPVRIRTRPHGREV